MDQQVHHCFRRRSKQSHDVRPHAARATLPCQSNLAYSWGPSAGAFAVGAQMVANGGDAEGLFRAAVMSCGSILPTGDTSTQQHSFDGFVEHAGCASAEDKLECLRGIPAENFTAAAASVTGFFGDGVGIHRG